jgi:hypothetical protein
VLDSADWDWDLIREGRVEWIGFSIALVVGLVVAWWISWRTAASFRPQFKGRSNPVVLCAGSTGDTPSKKEIRAVVSVSLTNRGIAEHRDRIRRNFP